MRLNASSLKGHKLKMATSNAQHAGLHPPVLIWSVAMACNDYQQLFSLNVSTFQGRAWPRDHFSS